MDSADGFPCVTATMDERYIGIGVIDQDPDQFTTGVPRAANNTDIDFG